MQRVVYTLFLFSLFLSGCTNWSEKSQPVAKAEWAVDSTEHFLLRAQREARSADSLDLLGQRLEETQKTLLEILHERQFVKLAVYFLKDRQTLTAYTGFPANGYTDTEKGIIYFVDKAPFHLALRHEIMHALSWRFWGPPQGYWLSEGIAVFASDNCGGYNLHSLVHLISRQNKILSFRDLEKDFDFRSLEPSLQAASLVKYIYEQYGVGALKNFWQKGLKSSKEIVGIPEAELIKSWRVLIDGQKFKTTIDWRKIKESGCE